MRDDQHQPDQHQPDQHQPDQHQPDDSLDRRLVDHFRTSSEEGPPPGLAAHATRRLHRRRTTRRVTAGAGAALVVVLLAVALPQVLDGPDEDDVILDTPPAVVETPGADPTPDATAAPDGQAPDDTSTILPTQPPSGVPSSSDPAATPQAPGPSETDPSGAPQGRAPDLLLSNGDAIGIRTADGQLLETIVVIPEEQIEVRLGDVAVQPGTDPVDPTFAYVEGNETGASVVVSQPVVGGGRQDLRLDGRVDAINGQLSLSARPVWSVDGDLAWLGHDEDGQPAVFFASARDSGQLQQVEEPSALPIPTGLSGPTEDHRFTLLGWERADATDGGALGTLLLQAGPFGGEDLDTSVHRIAVGQDAAPGGTGIGVSDPTARPVGDDQITGRPVVDRTGVGEQTWVLSGSPICADAGCPADAADGYVLRRGEQVIALPPSLDQSTSSQVPAVHAAGEDVIVIGQDPEDLSRVVLRVRPDGTATVLPYDAVSVSPVPVP